MPGWPASAKTRSRGCAGSFWTCRHSERSCRDAQSYVEVNVLRQLIRGTAAEKLESEAARHSQEAEERVLFDRELLNQLAERIDLVLAPAQV